MIDLLGFTLIGLGLAFNLFGCLGLVRMPDVYNRLQAATKCVTLGTCSLLAGVLVVSGFSDVGLKALLCALFVVITAPVAAHAISRGSYLGGVRLTDESVVDTYGEQARDEVEPSTGKPRPGTERQKVEAQP